MERSDTNRARSEREQVAAALFRGESARVRHGGVEAGLLMPSQAPAVRPRNSELQQLPVD